MYWVVPGDFSRQCTLGGPKKPKYKKSKSDGQLTYFEHDTWPELSFPWIKKLNSYIFALRKTNATRKYDVLFHKTTLKFSHWYVSPPNTYIHSTSRIYFEAPFTSLSMVFGCYLHQVESIWSLFGQNWVTFLHFSPTFMLFGENCLL